MGIIMVTEDTDMQGAFNRLAEVSPNTNTKLASVADQIIRNRRPPKA